MTTLLLTHPDCLLHDIGFGHPERPDRLRAIEHALEAPAFHYLAREQAPLADLAVIERVHPKAISRRSARRAPSTTSSGSTPTPPCARKLRRSACGPPAPRSTPSTRSCPAPPTMPSAPCGRRGTTPSRTRHGLLPVQQRGHRRAACPRRPWRRARGGGRFRRASRQRHAGRVLVRQGSVLRLDPPDAALPGTGALDETGVRQYLSMRRSSPATAATSFRDAFATRILPALDDFGPDLLLVSAGFDAHVNDPLPRSGSSRPISPG